MVYFLMTSLGEMATYLPTSGSFSTYASRYVDPSLGFALGWNYWFNWVITVAADVELSALAISYWEPMRVLPHWAWSLLFLVIIIGLNSLSVKVYGESEYWFALIKVVVVIVFLIVGCLTIFGILGGEYIGFKNLTVGDAPFIGEDTSLSSQILATLGVFLIAGYSFQGTELIGITAGESEEPEKSIPKAVKQVFWRILIFYVLAILVIGLLIPYTSPDLLGAESAEEIAKSPFTIVFQNIGLGFAAMIMNVVILTSVLSAANSGMYVSSRQLFSLSSHKYGPKMFKELNSNSVPTIALSFSSVFMVVCFIFERYNPSGYYMLLSMVGIIIMIIWMTSLVSQIRLRKAIIKQGKTAEEVLPYTAKTGVVGSYIALFSFAIITILQLVSDYITGGFLQMSYNLVCPLICLIMYITFKLVTKKKFVKLEEMNIDPYKEK